MKLQAIIVLGFVAFCVEGRNYAAGHAPINQVQVPQTIRNSLLPEIDCLLGREECNSITEVTKHALPNYLHKNMSHFLVQQRVKMNSIFRNIQYFYPNEWKTIKSNYERTLNTKQKEELDDALTRQIIADHPIDDMSREMMNCFLKDQCVMVVPNVKAKLYEMAAYGRCTDCTPFTMEFLYAIQDYLERKRYDEFTRAIVTKEQAYLSLKTSIQISKCIEYPAQTAADCVREALDPPAL